VFFFDPLHVYIHSVPLVKTLSMPFSVRQRVAGLTYHWLVPGKNGEWFHNQCKIWYIEIYVKWGTSLSIVKTKVL